MIGMMACPQLLIRTMQFRNTENSDAHFARKYLGRQANATFLPAGQPIFEQRQKKKFWSALDAR